VIELGEHHQTAKHEQRDGTDCEQHNVHDFLVVPEG
jgi:hypothetical protein